MLSFPFLCTTTADKATPIYSSTANLQNILKTLNWAHTSMDKSKFQRYPRYMVIINPLLYQAS